MLKKIVKVSLLSIGLAALSFYLLMVGLAYLDTTERSFDSYQEVAAAGMIERGMAPAFMPKSATDIHVYANMDGGGVVTRFTFADDFDQFLLNQPMLPGVTSTSMGIVGDYPEFSAASYLVLIRIPAKDENRLGGRLLVNMKIRRAMYVQDHMSKASRSVS